MSDESFGFTGEQTIKSQDSHGRIYWCESGATDVLPVRLGALHLSATCCSSTMAAKSDNSLVSLHVDGF